jgi:hypothetical protein
MPVKVEKMWPKPAVLKEVRAVITMLGVDYIPSFKTLQKYTKCTFAIRKYGGMKWLAGELKMPTAREYSQGNGWTLEKVLDEIRRVMDIMGVHDRVPTQKELRKYSTVYAAMQRFGTNEELAAMLGVKPTRKTERGIGGPKLLEPAEGPCSMEDIVRSRAFEIQRKAGRPYGEIQQEQTLQQVGTIDVSQYAGMKSYAERMQHGN